MSLYYRNAGAASGLCLLPKLKYEHVYLTSRSKMRVDLAAQVRLYIGGPIGIVIFICTAHGQSGHE